LIGTADKRASTPLAKTEQEIEDVKAGFVPGTDRSQPIEDPRMQSEMLERLKLQRQKSISDVDSRKRALFASNIDKTLENIDVDHLTQYAGFKGGMSKAIQEGLAPLGKESKEYGKYQKALTGAKLLAKQVRQFYGDSITPEMQKGLQSITNPATWSNNPKIAKQNFNVVKNLLKKETGTYRGALKGTGEFQEQEESSELTFNPITGGFE
ncbi:MAG TPA: hypothetical protein VK616_04455, partial [Flavitalea sp.]|nr:hypothetical protein [Flavitalea sp.]